MVSKLRRYATTITGSLVTVALSLISDFILHLPNEITWLTFFVGSIVTITATLLEQNILDGISAEINQKLGIYELLEQIEDEELYSQGKTAIEKCRVELENLSKGILRLETGQLFRYLIQITESAKSSIQVTQIISDDETIDRLLQSADAKPWYQQNVKLADRGIVFERLFIILRTKAVDSSSGKLRTNLESLLKRQAADKLKVMLVWQEELEQELVQDFGIIDGKVVIVTSPAWVGQYSNIVVYRRKFDVDRYIATFESLRSKGQTLELAKSSLIQK
jgi:hypothetical protein